MKKLLAMFMISTLVFTTSCDSVKEDVKKLDEVITNFESTDVVFYDYLAYPMWVELAFISPNKVDLDSVEITIESENISIVQQEVNLIEQEELMSYDVWLARTDKVDWDEYRSKYLNATEDDFETLTELGEYSDNIGALYEEEALKNPLNEYNCYQILFSLELTNSSKQGNISKVIIKDSSGFELSRSVNYAYNMPTHEGNELSSTLIAQTTSPSFTYNGDLVGIPTYNTMQFVCEEDLTINQISGDDINSNRTYYRVNDGKQIDEGFFTEPFTCSKNSVLSLVFEFKVEDSNEYGFNSKYAKLTFENTNQTYSYDAYLGTYNSFSNFDELLMNYEGIDYSKEDSILYEKIEDIEFEMKVLISYEEEIYLLKRIEENND